MKILDRKLLQLSDTQKLAQEVVQILQPRHILLLEGEMGVGKTEFVRALVTALQAGADLDGAPIVESQLKVSSPSFSIHNSYQTSRGTIDHLDLYRVSGEDDLESTGFWDLFSQPQACIAIEWSDRLDQKLLPKHWPQLKLKFSFVPNSAVSGLVRQVQLESR